MNIYYSLISASLLVSAVLMAPSEPPPAPDSGPYAWNPSPEPATAFDGGKDVTLHLYTQKNPVNSEHIQIGDDSSSQSFNPDHQTRFLIHGWRGNFQMFQDFAKAYIATGREYNLVLVDWSGPANRGLFDSRDNSVLVGDYVGKVIKHLISARGLKEDNVVVIGHSMGGHIAGIVGNRLDGRIAAVMALDPASIYDDLPLEDRLDISDAKFVQVIHTNGGAAGILDSRGHADFFPNGGTSQVGCGEDLWGICSHMRAVNYYLESISSKHFIATQCSNYEEFSAGNCSSNEHAVMGEWTPLNTSGSFFLRTNENKPFGRGENGI